MDEYYYNDGREVIGPHSLRELQEIHSHLLINSQTPVMRKGEKDWQTLGAYCDLNAPKCQPLGLDSDIDALYIPIAQPSAKAQPEQTEDQKDEQGDQTQVVTVKATEDLQESIREEEETLREQRTTRHQLLRQIRAELDSLIPWGKSCYLLKTMKEWLSRCGF